MRQWSKLNLRHFYDGEEFTEPRIVAHSGFTLKMQFSASSNNYKDKNIKRKSKIMNMK